MSAFTTVQAIPSCHPLCTRKYPNADVVSSLDVVIFNFCASLMSHFFFILRLSVTILAEI